jgi:dodecin
MAIHKVIEVSALSTEGFEDAVRAAVRDVTKTVQNVRSVYVQELLAEVENNQVSAYRAICKVTFEVRE